MFDLPRSTWDDYDRSAISQGGGVWPRTAKQIPVSAQTRLALGIDAEELTPAGLISAILRAPVDLIYNGGIGTYVKASTESHADAGDRVNDDLRVDGKDLRARVVAEGGNLGFTQRGRIEFALRGGRIITDFIDNSAGVNTSDHEVNLKILCGMAIARGELSLAERDLLLAEVEQDVVRHVLYDNFLQAQILSQEVELSPHRMEAFEDLMQAMEAEGVLDRELEALPTGEEMAERRRAGRGMTRPELAVLLANAKQGVTDALLGSSLPDSEYIEQDLRAYFPEKVVERFGKLIADHPLRRELVAMIVANDVVNSQGITFVSRVVSETGAEARTWCAYRIARDDTGAVARWERVEALVGSLEPSLLDELMAGTDRLVEITSRWYLRHAPGQLGRAIEADAEPFRAFAEAVPVAAPETWRQERERAAWRLMDRGLPEEVARGHVVEPFLVHGPNVVSVASASATRSRGHACVLPRRQAGYIDWLEAA
jgi:glutamate dehydrogenase